VLLSNLGRRTAGIIADAEEDTGNHLFVLLVGYEFGKDDSVIPKFLVHVSIAEEAKSPICVYPP
jgi:hypothetical protein